jgi:hypothetical protein
LGARSWSRGRLRGDTGRDPLLASAGQLGLLPPPVEQAVTPKLTVPPDGNQLPANRLAMRAHPRPRRQYRHDRQPAKANAPRERMRPRLFQAPCRSCLMMISTPATASIGTLMKSAISVGLGP